MAPLNSDHLRTFLAILDTGSVTAGAARIGRSQSATSLKIRLLEKVVGQPLFRRHGRGVTLTPAGETLRPVALDVIRSLDAVLADLRAGGLRGRLRIGVPDDHHRSDLAAILSRFTALHPDVDLEVQCALGAGFAVALANGDLDLAVHEVPAPQPHDIILRTQELVWMRSRDHDLSRHAVLPIAVFDRACWWRDVALAGLEAAGQRYRIVFSSESVVGVTAAVRAGIAAGFLSTESLSKELRPLSGVTVRHPTYLVLQRAPKATGPVGDAMAQTIKEAFAPRA